MRLIARRTCWASVRVRNPERERYVGRDPSRIRLTVTEKLSPGRFAAFSRSYAESSRETVRLPIYLHIYTLVYVDWLAADRGSDVRRRIKTFSTASCSDGWHLFARHTHSLRQVSSPDGREG